MVASWKGMRIIALPLTTRAAANSRTSSSLLPLTYYHFQTPAQKTDDRSNQSIIKRITNRAAGVWSGLGNAPEGSWKRTVYVYGEKLIDRIDFEELSLQGLDPSLGPRIRRLRHGTEKDSSSMQIPIFYPPSIDLGHGSSSPLPHLQFILSKRTPHHRRGFYKWLIIAPLTAPFALVPVIPNLPFFYAAWRTWSHYRAWKASEYMEDLISSNHVLPQSSPGLDEVYSSYPPPQVSTPPGEKDHPVSHQNSGDNPSIPEQPRLLLSSDAIPRIVSIFNLSDSAGANMLRALKQARIRLANTNQ